MMLWCHDVRVRAVVRCGVVVVVCAVFCVLCFVHCALCCVVFVVCVRAGCGQETLLLSQTNQVTAEGQKETSSSFVLCVMYALFAVRFECIVRCRIIV